LTAKQETKQTKNNSQQIQAQTDFNTDLLDAISPTYSELANNIYTDFRKGVILVRQGQFEAAGRTTNSIVDTIHTMDQTPNETKLPFFSSIKFLIEHMQILTVEPKISVEEMKKIKTGVAMTVSKKLFTKLIEKGRKNGISKENFARELNEIIQKILDEVFEQGVITIPVPAPRPPITITINKEIAQILLNRLTRIIIFSNNAIYYFNHPQIVFELSKMVNQEHNVLTGLKRKIELAQLYYTQLVISIDNVRTQPVPYIINVSMGSLKIANTLIKNGIMATNVVDLMSILVLNESVINFIKRITRNISRSISSFFIKINQAIKNRFESTTNSPEFYRMVHELTNQKGRTIKDVCPNYDDSLREYNNILRVEKEQPNYLSYLKNKRYNQRAATSGYHSAGGKRKLKLRKTKRKVKKCKKCKTKCKCKRNRKSRRKH
tara:strand:+ start:9016 stop:10320 length:1305 start_codon:yes stop_codon:yes gene_type:complete